MNNYKFITAQGVFGPYSATTVDGAKRQWAEEINCLFTQLPRCEVVEL